MSQYKPSPAQQRVLQLRRDPALDREIAAAMRRNQAFVADISAALRAQGVRPHGAAAYLAAGMLGNVIPR